MDKTKLFSAGIDYDDGLKRFSGNAVLYEKFLVRFFDDKMLSELKEQLDKNDYDNAFRTAHNLKGMAGNLSIKTLYNTICVIVEELRSKNTQADYTTLYNNVIEDYQKAKKAVRG